MGYLDNLGKLREMKDVLHKLHKNEAMVRLLFQLYKKYGNEEWKIFDLMLVDRDLKNDNFWYMDKEFSLFYINDIADSLCEAKMLFHSKPLYEEDTGLYLKKVGLGLLGFFSEKADELSDLDTYMYGIMPEGAKLMKEIADYRKKNIEFSEITEMVKIQIRPEKSKYKKIFISYNWNDQEKVMDISKVLNNNKAEVIIDTESMKSGEKIKEFIKRSISESAVTLSIISINSLYSAWVAYETIFGSISHEMNNSVFIPAFIDKSFLDIKITDDILKYADKKIKELEDMVKARISRNESFIDLSVEHEKYCKFKNNIPTIISSFRQKNCIDLSGDNVEKGIAKILTDIQF